MPAWQRSPPRSDLQVTDLSGGPAANPLGDPEDLETVHAEHVLGPDLLAMAGHFTTKAFTP